MIPHELLATTRVPDHDRELRCFREDDEFTIWIDGTELMSSRVHGSEEALAELAIARLGARSSAHLLVGGLGMGFTLARALALVSADAVVEVAELVPAVVDWNRDLLGHCAGHPLRDPRTRLFVGDVRDALSKGSGTFDAVMLDVDNGPEGLSRPGNDRLYDEPGLAALRAALRADGVLAVWSSRDDAAFDARLRGAGFSVQKHHVRARRTEGPRRTIWVAART